jgi:uncharacterized protein (DUF1697 family)
VALVVLLRGVNVGGHRTFRPSALAGQLTHLGAVSIGAAGTFVIPGPVTPAQLRAEFARRLPFDAVVTICRGRDIVRLIAHNPYGNQPAGPGVVRFVSFLSQRPRSAPPLPMSFPSSGRWLLRILARDRRFVFGVYRRHLKVIGYLGTFDRIFRVPATTRNWNTITAIAAVVAAVPTRARRPGRTLSSGRSAHE